MRVTQWMLSCALSSALVAGCSGGSGPDTVGELIETVGEAFCKRQERCGMLEGSIGDCVDALENLVCNGDGSDDDGVDCSMELPEDFDASRLDECTEAYEDSECDSMELPASCQAVIDDNDGDGDEYETAGDFAVVYGEAVCDHFQECDQLEGSYADCVIATADDICTGDACSGPPPASPASLDACLDAIDAASCAATEPPDDCNF